MEKTTQGRKKRRIVTPRKSVLGDRVEVDYKDIEMLRKFINQKGRITSRRINGNTAKQQRRVSAAIRRARVLALLPYIGR